MGTSKTKIIEDKIYSILVKYSHLTYDEGISELENYIFTLVDVIDKEVVMKVLNNIYGNLSAEYEEEIVGDIMNRLHGFCVPGNEIKWK